MDKAQGVRLLILQKSERVVNRRTREKREKIKKKKTMTIFNSYTHDRKETRGHDNRGREREVEGVGRWWWWKRRNGEGMGWESVDEGEGRSQGVNGKWGGWAAHGVKEWT